MKINYTVTGTLGVEDIKKILIEAIERDTDDIISDLSFTVSDVSKSDDMYPVYELTGASFKFKSHD